MAKISFKSKQQTNMSHTEYMVLHRRMYALIKDGRCYIYLYTDYDINHDIFVDVTRDCFDEFLNYELDFNTMLSIFAALCIKVGTLPVPFNINPK